MARKPRTWLCQGCDYAPQEGVIDGKIFCRAAEETIPAVAHKKFRRFESCPYRRGYKPNFLQILAWRCRALAAQEGRQPTPEEVAGIERKLRIEMGIKD